MITLGGNAELELVDSLDPFSEGIVFSVMPPKKSWKNISNLSGGEKVITSRNLQQSFIIYIHIFSTFAIYTDFKFPSIGLCTSPFQTHAYICNG